jgi:hypothetical protein
LPCARDAARFQNGEHFPLPDLLICSTGAVCDDFSAIAQRLERFGHAIFWWEMPRRRPPAPGEISCELPGNLTAPKIQVDCVRAELQRVAQALGELVGTNLDQARLAEGIRSVNHVRQLLAGLRQAVYSAPGAPLPALEMLGAGPAKQTTCAHQQHVRRLCRNRNHWLAG